MSRLTNTRSAPCCDFAASRSRWLRRLLAGAALIVTSGLLSAQEIALQDGESVSFSLPAAAFSGGLYFDVSDQPAALTISLVATDNASLDVDLLVRYGTPLEGPGQSGAADPQSLFDQAQYRSASSAGNETLTLLRSGRLPLRAGRWYIGALNFEAQPVNVVLTASTSNTVPYVPISVDFSGSVVAGESACNVSPWNDSTPVVSAGGNPGTTLGTQRRNAMLESARLLSEELRPTVPIRIRACWDDLGSGNALTLAQAGSNYLFLDDVGIGSHMPFLGQRFSYYSAAAAARQSGTSTCRFAGGPCNTADVRATFNSVVDTPEGLGSAGFYYGFDRNHGSDIDFISVGIHEITHGLGFFGLISTGPTDDSPDRDPLGTRLTDYADAFDNQVRWVQGIDDIGTPLLDLTTEDRASALTSGNGLRFAGQHVVSSPRNPASTQAAPASYARLYAPSTVKPGSTLSHFDTTLSNQLMGPFASAAAPHDLGLARDVLFDVGWDPAILPAPVFGKPRSGQYYDPRHSGHGIGLYRVAGLDDFYFLTFYTFDSAGNPEYYISSGKLVDGVLAPAVNAYGDSLVRPVYVHGDSNPNQIDTSPGFDGQIRLDFNDAAASPACRDGYPGRPLDGVLGVMTWSINGESAQWCMQRLSAPEPLGADYSNLWAKPGDGGWGISSLSYSAGGQDGMGLLLYYPDAAGRARWATVQTGAFLNGESYTVLQVEGFCRTCERPDVLGSQPVGSMQLQLVDPAIDLSTPSPVTIQVDYDGNPLLRFQRNATALPFADMSPTEVEETTVSSAGSR